MLPTLCDLAGIASPVGVQGRSIVNVLREGIDHAALITHYMPTADLHNFSICDARYRYAWYAGRQERELFDHEADPHELVNLAGQASHAQTVARLHERLLEEHLATDAPSSGRIAQW